MLASCKHDAQDISVNYFVISNITLNTLLCLTQRILPKNGYFPHVRVCFEIWCWLNTSQLKERIIFYNTFNFRKRQILEIILYFTKRTYIQNAEYFLEKHKIEFIKR